MLVGKAGMVSAAVKERLAVPEGVESILVGYGVRSAAVGAAAETEHGTFAGIIQACGERSQTALREYVPHRQVFQSRTIGQSFIALKAEPCQSAGLGSTALLEYVGLLGGDAAHIVCGIRVARHTCQSIGITHTCTARSKDILM